MLKLLRMLSSLHLGKINSGILMYQFTFKPSHLLFFDVVVVSDLNKNLVDRRIWRKQCTDRGICIPLFTPFFKHDVQGNVFDSNCVEMGVEAVEMD